MRAVILAGLLANVVLTPAASAQSAGSNGANAPNNAAPLSGKPVAPVALPYGGSVPSENSLLPSHQPADHADNSLGPDSWPGETPSDVRDANSVPRILPPQLSPLSPDKPLTSKQSAEVSMVHRWRSRTVRPTLGADGWMHLVYGDGEPSIVCAPLHLCTIALQPGELLTAPADISDPRWLVHPRFTLVGGKKAVSLVLKPTDAGLNGTIVITTDRRIYSINLVSRTNDYMPLVKFDYAEGDGDGQLTAPEWSAVAMAGQSGPSDPCDSTPIVPPASYHISGEPEPWRPVQVWSVATPVGQKTCVEFASDIGSKPLPALVALGNDGTWFSGPTPQIVNFRYVNHRFEIDEALDHFELISGVGSDQEKVEIRKVGQS